LNKLVHGDLVLAVAGLMLRARRLEQLHRLQQERCNDFIQRSSLLVPREAQWAYMKSKREDSTFITVLRVNVQCYVELCGYIPDEDWYRRRPNVQHPRLGATRVLFNPSSPFFMGADDCMRARASRRHRS